MKQKLLALGAAATAAVMSSSAMALDVDFSAVTADITTVGTGLVALAAVAMGFKWVKAAFF